MEVTHTRLSEGHAKLQMGDRIRSHHQLEAKDARGEVVAHIRGPASLLPPEVLAYMLDGFIKEGAGPNRGIKYLNLGAADLPCETVLTPALLAPGLCRDLIGHLLCASEPGRNSELLLE